MVLDQTTQNEAVFRIYCALVSNPAICFVQEGQIAKAQLQVVMYPHIIETAIKAYLQFKDCPDDAIAKVEDAIRLAQLQSSPQILKL